MSEATQIKTILGKVVSDKMDKTIVVAVEEYVPHKLYKKRIKRTTKYHAHDAQNEAGMGDIVRIKEHRPISKSKTFVLVEIVKKAD